MTAPRAYLTGSADYVTTYRNLHLAVLEIGFNAVGLGGLPLVASMPLDPHSYARELITTVDLATRARTV